MAWTTPRTWVAGEVPTAAQLNAHVRDNLNFLHTLHGARVFNSAVQSIANSAGEGFAAVTFDTETFDSDGFHSTASNTARITIPTGFGGKYFIHGSIEYAANAGGNRRDANLRKNGATMLAKSRVPSNGASVTARVSVQAIADLAATDYVELGANQDSGGALNTGFGTELTWFEAYLVGV